MTEMPEKSPSEPPERPDRHERDDSADTERDTIALPSHVAGSGTLDRLVETARDYARQAASENTLKAYTKDWAHFARWCRMRGADPLPSSSQLIGLYIADLAAPSGKAPALSASSIERRLSGLTWGYAQRGERLDRKDRHIASVLAGIRRKHARPPAKPISRIARSRRPRKSWGRVASMSRRSSGRMASFCAGGRACLRRMPARTLAMWRSLRSSRSPR